MFCPCISNHMLWSKKGKKNQRLKTLKNMVALVVPVELFTLKRLQVNSHYEAVSYCQEKSTAYLLCVKIFQMWPPGPYPFTMFYMLTAQGSLAPPACPEPLASPMNSPQSSTALSQSYNNVPFHHFSTILIHQPKDLSTNNTLKTDLATTDQNFCADSISESEQMTLIECNAGFPTGGIENFVVWAWPWP